MTAEKSSSILSAAAQAKLRGIMLALVIGSIGGAFFAYFEMPLAWMLGAMCSTTAAALYGIKLQHSGHLRSAMVAILGTLIGGTFSPAVLERIWQWTGGLFGMLVFIALLTALMVWCLHRFAGFNRPTAFFSGMPGGLGAMTVIGEDFGGDPRIIPLVHALRILVVVFSIPFFVQFVMGYDVPPTAGLLGTRPSASAVELAILFCSAGTGFVIGMILNLPSAQLICPLIFSAGLYSFGIVEGSPPSEIVAVAQIIIGAAIGARFVGIRLQTLKGPFIAGVLSSFVMFLAAVVGALILSPLLDIPPLALVLALAPGGLAEMSLIALALDADTAFVATMHIFRITLIIFCAPLIFRLAKKWP